MQKYRVQWQYVTLAQHFSKIWGLCNIKVQLSHAVWGLSNSNFLSQSTHLISHSVQNKLVTDEVTVKKEGTYSQDRAEMCSSRVFQSHWGEVNNIHCNRTLAVSGTRVIGVVYPPECGWANQLVGPVAQHLRVVQYFVDFSFRPLAVKNAFYMVSGCRNHPKIYWVTFWT